MNSDGWKQLAQDRIEDARVLLEAGRWTAAYPLAGFAIECGLKARILSYLASTGKVFDDPKYLKDLAECRTHDFRKLVRLAGLENEQNAEFQKNLTYKMFWDFAKDWNESSRYTRMTERKARDLYETVTNDSDGVLAWIRRYW